MADTIYIALVSTHDEIAGTGRTPEEAVKVACQFARKYLRDRGVLGNRTNKDIADYFGVYAFPVEIGGAAYVRG